MTYMKCVKASNNRACAALRELLITCFRPKVGGVDIIDPVRQILLPEQGKGLTEPWQQNSRSHSSYETGHKQLDHREEVRNSAFSGTFSFRAG